MLFNAFIWQEVFHSHLFLSAESYTCRCITLSPVLFFLHLHYKELSLLTAACSESGVQSHLKADRSFKDHLTLSSQESGKTEAMQTEQQRLVLLIGGNFVEPFYTRASVYTLSSTSTLQLQLLLWQQILN